MTQWPTFMLTMNTHTFLFVEAWQLNTLTFSIMWVVFTIYFLLFEQVELLHGVACCCSVWRLVALCLVPWSHPSHPWTYIYRSLQYSFRTRRHTLGNWHHFLCSQCISCSLAPFISFLGTRYHFYTLSAMPVVHCILWIIYFIPRTLIIFSLVPKLIGVWRRFLFLVDCLGAWVIRCLVEVMLISFCWLMAQVLGIFFLFLRWMAVLGFCQLLGAARGAGFFLFLELLGLLRDTRFSVCPFLFQLSVLGICPYFLYMYNVNFCEKWFFNLAVKYTCNSLIICIHCFFTFLCMIVQFPVPAYPIECFGGS